jgi:DNA/RNA-binding domain of Phe-tRNA-synthetase-like protein
MDDQFVISQEWIHTYPGAAVGVLIMSGVSNPRDHSELEARKRELEEQIRREFGSADRESLKAHPILAAYRAYYQGFKKTYHVQHQLESVVHKGKSIPKVAALVEAMFMAELKNLLLTAGHDMDQVALPVTIDIASGDETYTGLNGQVQALKAKDMFIADNEGVLSSIIHGPDQRTRINPGTKRVLFTVYAPAGIGMSLVDGHLGDIRENVRIVSSGAEVEIRQIIDAGSSA